MDWTGCCNDGGDGDDDDSLLIDLTAFEPRDSHHPQQDRNDFSPLFGLFLLSSA